MKLLYHPKHQHLDLAVDLCSTWEFDPWFSKELVVSMVRSMTNLALTKQQILFLIDQTDRFCNGICNEQCLCERETSGFTRDEFVEYLTEKLVEANIELSSLNLITDALLLLYSLDCVAYFNDENEQVQNDSDEIEVLVAGKWERFKIDTIRQWWLDRELWVRELGVLDYYYNNYIVFTAADLSPISKIGSDCAVFAANSDCTSSSDNLPQEEILTLWVNFRIQRWWIKEMTNDDRMSCFFEAVLDEEEKGYFKYRLNKVEQHLSECDWVDQPLLHRFNRCHILHKEGRLRSIEELPF